MANANGHHLGDLASSEQLIRELYIDLRRRTRQWAGVTKQTAQARMGYIGQHLVSVVTGCAGGKTGARGVDLVEKDGSPSEIKTCYRVDQLGKCNTCEAKVSPDEDECSKCGSTDVTRPDDSKWLISVMNDTELGDLLVPKFYYLVLFEFTDLATRDTIMASIWRVDPNAPGFLLCLVDYYKNIRSKSTSKAPFNLWPYSLKFEMMRPVLIYRSFIKSDDTIQTTLFPGLQAEQPHPFSNIKVHGRAKVSKDLWLTLAKTYGYRMGDPGIYIDQHLSAGRVTNAELCDAVAKAVYNPLVQPHLAGLPAKIKTQVAAAMK